MKASDDGAWDRLLEQLIKAPRNDVLLLQAVRALGLPDCVELLGRLVMLTQEVEMFFEEGDDLEWPEISARVRSDITVTFLPV